MENSIRYFNLKIGKKNINGSILKVSVHKKPNQRLEDFAVDGDSCKFKFLKNIKAGEVYEIINPNAEFVRGSRKDALGGRIGVPVSIEKGKPDVLQLKVTYNGKLSIYKNKIGKKVYISEIDKNNAESKREEAGCWNLQRAYMFE